MRILSLILIFVNLLSSGAAQLIPAPQSAQEQRRKKYLDLSSRIYFWVQPGRTDVEHEAVNAVPDAAVEEVTSQLHDLVTAEVESALAGSKPSAQDVVSAIQGILGETSIAKWDTDSNTPFARYIDLEGSEVLMVSYGILRGGGALPNTRSYLEFYATDGGAWHRKAAADLDFDGRMFSVSPVDAGLARQAWILAWGRRFGDTGGRLLVCLYSFDGTEARAIWRREGDDLIRGTVTVSGRSVILEYDKEYHSSERVRETLMVTPEGLK